MNGNGNGGTPGYKVRIPARFLKEPRISSDAKAFRSVLGAFADGISGRSCVSPKRLQAVLGWGRHRRERAQAELVAKGWLRLEWERGIHGRWARRVYWICEPPSTVAHFERSGANEHVLLNDQHHSQVLLSSHVRSFTTISDMTPKTRKNFPGGSDLT